MRRAKSVDEYIDTSTQWQEELIVLRNLLQQTEMEETVKWGGPAYTVNGKNVIGLGAFKEFVAIWFFQGALLKDDKKKLVNAQEGVTKALRQWRFTSIEEVNANLAIVKAYALEAIENQKAGKSIKPAKKKPLIIPEQLEAAFEENGVLKDCFENFSLSKKREFAEHISDAKREETKLKRLEKIKPMILNGIGLNDKYRNC